MIDKIPQVGDVWLYTGNNKVYKVVAEGPKGYAITNPFGISHSKIEKDELVALYKGPFVELTDLPVSEYAPMTLEDLVANIPKPIKKKPPRILNPAPV